MWYIAHVLYMSCQQAFALCEFDYNYACCWQPLRWRHNERDGVSNHQPNDCLRNHIFRRRSKKTLKLSVTGLCAGNSPVTGEFPAQMASIAENVSIWWRHHELTFVYIYWFVSFQQWTDEYLTWDPRDFGNVSLVKLHQSDIWTPDIMLYNTWVS